MEAYITLISTDSYASGAMVLARRLLDLQTSKSLACLVTPNVSDHVQQLLRDCQYDVIQVDPIYTTRPDNLALLGRPDLAATLTKIELWRLNQYKKLVFLDADTFPLRNVDELFDRPAFAAAPDVGWPDCFNSGLFVAEPSERVYSGLMQMAKEKGSFDGGDQGLLNSYFHNWPETNEHRLAFTYNTTPSAAYSYAPAFLEFKHKIAVVHFIGKDKPWHAQRFADGSIFQPRGPVTELIQQWWDVWDKFYGRDILPANLISPAASFSKYNSQADDTSCSYSTASPKWLEFATPAPSKGFDMEELHKDIDRIVVRMHNLNTHDRSAEQKAQQHHQPKKTHTTRPHLFEDDFSPRQNLQKKPPSERVGTHAGAPAMHVAWPEEVPQRKRSSRTPSPSWGEHPPAIGTAATARESHYPWDKFYQKGMALSAGNLPTSSGPSSPWERSPGEPIWKGSSPRDHRQDPAISPAPATMTKHVPSIWDDMGTYSFDLADKPKKTNTSLSQTAGQSVWADMASSRAMAFSWNDDVSSVGSSSPHMKGRKVRLRQDEQELQQDGEIPLEAVPQQEPLKSLKMTGEIARRRSKGKESDISSSDWPETHSDDNALDKPDRPKKSSMDEASNDKSPVQSILPTSSDRGLQTSSSSHIVHQLSLKSDRASYAEESFSSNFHSPTASMCSAVQPSPESDGPASSMYITRQTSTEQSQYISSQGTADAEETMLEFELGHQDTSSPE